ncbi:unnamed protein product [Trichobilharzia szidati]|nr:unnamed protein product [Trichobilharzia szidati]
MGLSCGYRCLQLLLIIFNIGVFICGIGLIAAGAYALSSVVNHWKDVEPSLQYLIIFTIALGCIIFLLGALGMFGACTKSVCLLTTYCILLVLLIIGQVAAGIIAVKQKPKIKEKVSEALSSLVRRFYTDEHVKKVLDEIQHKLQCCGAKSWSDYGTAIPPSCYEGTTLHAEGCIKRVSELAKKNMNAIIVCVFVFAFLQAICLVFAICVLMAIKQGNDD